MAGEKSGNNFWMSQPRGPGFEPPQARFPSVGTSFQPPPIRADAPPMIEDPGSPPSPIAYWSRSRERIVWSTPAAGNTGYIGAYGPDTTQDPTVTKRGIFGSPVFDLRANLKNSVAINPVGQAIWNPEGGAASVQLQLWGLGNINVRSCSIYLLQFANSVFPDQTAPVGWRQDVTLDIYDGAARSDGTNGDSVVFCIEPPNIRYWRFSLIFDIYDAETVPGIEIAGQGA